jgi:hypothetical protein
MNSEQTEPPSLCVSQEQLLAFVRSMTGAGRGREDDEHPLPPGPWDPVIRVALEQIHAFGPHPEPWRDAHHGRLPGRTAEFVEPVPDASKFIFGSIFAKHPEAYDALGGGHSFGDEVALNPQPLPPRLAVMIAVARAVIRRSELFQEIADAMSDGSGQGSPIVSGYMSRFSDDWCGTGFKLKWPFPGPRPNWFPHELEGLDLLVLATHFDQAANETYSPELRQNLANAGAKFVEAGVARTQAGMDRAPGNVHGSTSGSAA